MKTTLALVRSSVAHRQVPGELRLAQRILIYPNELYRVPSCYRQVHARQGIAHISHGGRDLIVFPGESATLQRSSDTALVSPLRNDALVLELFV